MAQDYVNGLDVQGPGGWKLGVHGYHVIAALILSVGIAVLIYVTHRGFDRLEAAQLSTTTTISNITKARDQQMIAWQEAQRHEHTRLTDQYDAVLYLLCSTEIRCRQLNIAPPRALRELQGR